MKFVLDQADNGVVQSGVHAKWDNWRVDHKGWRLSKWPAFGQNKTRVILTTLPFSYKIDVCYIFYCKIYFVGKILRQRAC